VVGGGRVCTTYLGVPHKRGGVPVARRARGYVVVPSIKHFVEGASGGGGVLRGTPDKKA
jgi:hypothetical protein